MGALPTSSQLSCDIDPQCPSLCASHQCRALVLLAAAPEGCAEPLLRIDHGIDTPVTVALVEEGLATAHKVRMRAGTRTLEIVKVQITDAGRAALGR